MRGKMIVDLQYGSTGKGLIAGFLAERDQPDTVATAWAANAGHTYIDSGGAKFVHTMLANAVVSPNLKRILIGPGSLIDPINLRKEMEQCHNLLRGVDVLIHPHAAIITQEHRDLEAGPMTKIGSTKKGVGEAAIQRIRRDPYSLNVACDRARERIQSVHPLLDETGLSQFVATVDEYNNALDRTRVLMVEGAQGFGLSMYHGFYPFTTSRDVTPNQIAADCALPPSVYRSLDIVGTLRTFPIRVANRFDELGKQVGWSGPCYDDQSELDWKKDLGIEPELTTVTKLPRRIFSFSMTQLSEALRMCGPCELFLNFINYLPSHRHAFHFINQINKAAEKRMSSVEYVGAGPEHGDVYDNSDTARPSWDQTTKDEGLKQWLADQSYLERT